MIFVLLIGLMDRLGEVVATTVCRSTVYVRLILATG
jgi:hypothetical protein